MSTEPTQTSSGEPALAHKLGPFDATLIVMGGIIGAGIFKNPAVVAKLVHTPTMVFGAWIIGGIIALIGAFVYAELAVLRPRVGGQYAYLRDAYHPIVAFLYGWTLLLVIQTGGMAAVAIIFADYLRELTGIGLSSPVLAVITLAVLTAINCFGVRAGSNVQNVLMVIKIVAIAALVGVGLTVAPPVTTSVTAATVQADSGGLAGLTAAMVPVIFAYGGWQTASFLTGEMRNPRRDLPRGLLIGVLGVITLYLSVTYVCVHALGVDGLAATKTPASEVMLRALGPRGARLIALGIAISTVGFLSQSVLTAPRVYYAMARDGVFFKIVGRLNPKTQAPVIAIVLQSIWAAVLVLCVDYGQMLDYVVSVDVLFFGLTGASLLIFRARARRNGTEAAEGKLLRVPGHPITTLVFVLACWAVSLNAIITSPRNAGGGVVILIIGVIVYQVWAKNARPAELDASR